MARLSEDANIASTAFLLPRSRDWYQSRAKPEQWRVAITRTSSAMWTRLWGGVGPAVRGMTVRTHCIRSKSSSGSLFLTSGRWDWCPTAMLVGEMTSTSSSETGDLIMCAARESPTRNASCPAPSVRMRDSTKAAMSFCFPETVRRGSSRISRIVRRRPTPDREAPTLGSASCTNARSHAMSASSVPSSEDPSFESPLRANWAWAWRHKIWKAVLAGLLSSSAISARRCGTRSSESGVSSVQVDRSVDSASVTHAAGRHVA
mmetsp:Transcript_14141/g.40188  ORF Transcript_14141/g.40188 Transcript_14141/m.40188 type:complete len:261 (-) Transcript_14141:1111-1893(-)